MYLCVHVCVYVHTYTYIYHVCVCVCVYCACAVCVFINLENSRSTQSIVDMYRSPQKLVVMYSAYRSYVSQLILERTLLFCRSTLCFGVSVFALCSNFIILYRILFVYLSLVTLMNAATRRLSHPRYLLIPVK